MRATPTTPRSRSTARRFDISGPLNYEAGATRSVRIKTDDGNGGTFEKQFTIDVNNLNDAPTDIDLSDANVDENEPVATTVGLLSSDDEDTGGRTRTRSPLPAAGDTDNASFQISGNELKTTASFDFETKSSYTIRLRTTDNGGQFFEKQFTISVNNVNDAPTNILIRTPRRREPAAAAPPSAAHQHRPGRRGDPHLHVRGRGGGADNGSFTIAGARSRRTPPSTSRRSRATRSVFAHRQRRPVLREAVHHHGRQRQRGADQHRLTGQQRRREPAERHHCRQAPDDRPRQRRHAHLHPGQRHRRRPTTVVHDRGQRAETAVVRLRGEVVLLDPRPRPPTPAALSFERCSRSPSPTSTRRRPNRPVRTPASPRTGPRHDRRHARHHRPRRRRHLHLHPGRRYRRHRQRLVHHRRQQPQTALVFDFEAKSSYRPRPRHGRRRAVLREGRSPITVTDVNETPTDIALSHSVAENRPTGTDGRHAHHHRPGKRRHIHLHAGRRHRRDRQWVASPSPAASCKTAAFRLREGSRRTRSASEPPTTGGLTFEKAFTIAVDGRQRGADRHQPLELAASTENQAVGNNGRHALEDRPRCGRHLHVHPGRRDRRRPTTARSRSRGNQLKTDAGFDFETKSQLLDPRAQSTDSGPLSSRRQFTITVTNVNETPVNTVPSAQTVNEDTNLSFTGLSVADVGRGRGQRPDDRLRAERDDHAGQRVRGDDHRLGDGRARRSPARSRR